MAARQVSLWLRPDAPAAQELDAVIGRLAEVHGTAVFPAHLTVLGMVELPAERAVAALSHFAGTAGPIGVRFDEVRCEAAWHRSLYLSAVGEPALRRLAERAAQAFEVTDPRPFEPHLSLQYSQLPIPDKLRLAARVELALPLTVRFDRLAVWQTPGSDAERWRLLGEWPLVAG